MFSLPPEIPQAELLAEKSRAGATGHWEVGEIEFDPRCGGNFLLFMAQRTSQVKMTEMHGFAARF